MIIHPPLCKPNLPLWSSAILEPLALVALTLLTYFNHQRTQTASSISLIFWPIYGINTLFLARTHVFTRIPHYRTHLYIWGAIFLLGITAFSLECVGPEDPENWENPIVTASVFSRWTFSYMTPLVKKGALQYITQDDLPPLVPEDESGRLGDDLQDARTRLYILSLLHTHYF